MSWRQAIVAMAETELKAASLVFSVVVTLLTVPPVVSAVIAPFTAPSLMVTVVLESPADTASAAEASAESALEMSSASMPVRATSSFSTELVEASNLAVVSVVPSSVDAATLTVPPEPSRLPILTVVDVS